MLPLIVFFSEVKGSYACRSQLKIWTSGMVVFFLLLRSHRFHLWTWSKNYWNQIKFAMTSVDFGIELNYHEMVLIEKKMAVDKSQKISWEIAGFDIFRVLKNIWKEKFGIVEMYKKISAFPLLFIFYLDILTTIKIMLNAYNFKANVSLCIKV